MLDFGTELENVAGAGGGFGWETAKRYLHVTASISMLDSSKRISFK